MKLNKTEREFREELYRKLEQGQWVARPVEDFRVPYLRAVVDLLGLEFKSEEPELPEKSKDVSLLVERVRALEARDAAIDRVLWATHFKPGEPWHGTKNCHVCKALHDLGDTKLSSGDDQ